MLATSIGSDDGETNGTKESTAGYNLAQLL